MPKCNKWKAAVRRRVNTNQWYLHVWGVHGKFGTITTLVKKANNVYEVSHDAATGGAAGVQPFSLEAYLGESATQPLVTVNSNQILSQPTPDHVASCSSNPLAANCDVWKGGVLKRIDAGSNNWLLLVWGTHQKTVAATTLAIGQVPNSWKLSHVLSGGVATTPFGEIADLQDSPTQPVVTINGVSAVRLTAATYDVETCSAT